MITVLYHNDADGFGAAYAIHSNLNEQDQKTAVYIPVQYGEPVPMIDEETTKLMVVDFSFDRATCDKLNAIYDEFVVIDHHESAAKELEGAEYAIFDQSKSGCVLTWEYMANSYTPVILNYVQDRDLWKFELPYSKAVNAYIATLPNTFEAWDEFDLEVATIAGGAILSFQDRQVESVCKRAAIGHVFGNDDLLAAVVNCTTNISETGHKLLELHPEVDFAVMWQEISNEGKLVYSLRSRKDGANVAAIAEAFGGGGHACAAGFESLL